MNKQQQIIENRTFFKRIAMIPIAILFVVLFWLFLHGFTYAKDAEFIYSFAGMYEKIFLSAIFFGVFPLLYYGFGKLYKRCNDKILTVIKWLAISLFFILQIVFLFGIRSYYKWDSGFVIGAAASLVEKGVVDQNAYYYLSVYPNQNTFVCITAILVKVSNLLGIATKNRPIIFNIFNTICLDISIFLIIPVLKCYIHRNLEKWEELRILCMILINPFWYLGVSYYYTITLSLPLTMGFLFIVLKDAEEMKKNIARWIVAGILLGVGYELRATAIILFIAFLLSTIWKMLEHKELFKEYVAKTIIVIISFLLSVIILKGVQASYIGINTKDTAFPTSHWVMMSLTEPYGHNAEDEAFTASFQTKEEKEIAVKNRLCDKLGAMSAKDYSHLILTKLYRTFGDGTNGYPVFLADGYGTGPVYELLMGGKKDFAILYHQGYYLFLLVGILMSICAFLRKPDSDYNAFMVLIFLFGAILFYILWEASEQYSVPFMTVMTSISMFGLIELKPLFEIKLLKSNVQKENKLSLLICLLSLAFGVMFIAWGLLRIHIFTKDEYEHRTVSAVQILANAPTKVDDSEVLIQKLTINQPFNQVVIQWRNEKEVDSTAVYEFVLCNANKNAGEEKIYVTDRIDAHNTGYNGVSEFNFDLIDPKVQKNTEYEMRIRKIEGDVDSDLAFVLYDMYGYTPYPGGDLILVKEDQTKQTLDASMLFMVSNKILKPYMTKKEYVMVLGLVFLCFIFIAICSKIEVIGKNEKYK